MLVALHPEGGAPASVGIHGPPLELLPVVPLELAPELLLPELPDPEEPEPDPEEPEPDDEPPAGDVDPDPQATAMALHVTRQAVRRIRVEFGKFGMGPSPQVPGGKRRQARGRGSTR
jgi:hypothetical protein